MARRQNIPRPRERTWDEVSDLGKIYVSSEVILYSIEDIVNMTRWSYTTVQKLFNDPSFPSADYGKSKIVEAHALIDFFSTKHTKARERYWR